jgi:hypothetical protein
VKIIRENAGSPQRIKLEVESLIFCGNSGIAD